MTVSNVILMSLIITIASAYPYGHQHLLNAESKFEIPQEYHQYGNRPAAVNKQFHFFTAPEESDTYDDFIPEDFFTKKVRVVVIKAPENNKITAAISKLATSLAEEKTAIYVLNKEHDLKGLTSQINRLAEEKTESPEVHFIKYKTPEEAELVAVNIKAQYDDQDDKNDVKSIKTRYADANGSKMKTSSSSHTVASLIGDPIHNSLLTDIGEETKNIPQHEKISMNDQLVHSSVTPFGERDISPLISYYLPPGSSNLDVDLRTQNDLPNK